MPFAARLAAALLFVMPAAPVLAQEQTSYDPVAEAKALIDSHQVSTNVPCSVPIPATWNASPWEQDAAMRRRQAFNDCLDSVMAREQDRLQALTYQVDELRIPNGMLDWSGIDHALDTKWAELEKLESKLDTRDMWANTAVEILDTFTGPGAPFDSSGYRQMPNPYAGPAYATPNPYPDYRRDSSVSAPGIK